MSARLTSRMIVDALIRAAHGAGGHATVLARGDEVAGAVLIQCADRGVPGPVLERILDHSGGYAWARVGPEDFENIAETASYLERRRSRDRDLWVVELDIAQAERFAAETIAAG